MQARLPSERAQAHAVALRILISLFMHGLLTTSLHSLIYALCFVVFITTASLICLVGIFA